MEVREHFGSVQAAGFYFYFLNMVRDLFHKLMEQTMLHSPAYTLTASVKNCYEAI